MFLLTNCFRNSKYITIWGHYTPIKLPTCSFLKDPHCRLGGIEKYGHIMWCQQNTPETLFIPLLLWPVAWYMWLRKQQRAKRGTHIVWVILLTSFIWVCVLRFLNVLECTELSCSFKRLILNFIFYYLTQCKRFTTLTN